MKTPPEIIEETKQHIRWLLGAIAFEKNAETREVIRVSADEWIDLLYKSLLQLDIEELEELKSLWVKCERKDCENKEGCNIANHYIDTIWNKNLDTIINKKQQQLKEYEK